MTNGTTTIAADLATEVDTIPIVSVVPWAVLAAVLAALVYYFVGSEQGATAVFLGTNIHEFVHDARHLLGFPCH